MCLPGNADACDACAAPKFKAVSPAARYHGRCLGYFLMAHLVVGLARCVSYSFSAALTDMYVVTYGYYITRRYFRARDADPEGGLCVTCESQQNVVCFLMLISIDFGLSVWTLVELLTNMPTIPMPVGLPEFDYRTLQLWQWYAGIGISAAVLCLFAGEIVFGWLLHTRLEAEDIDHRYQKLFARDLESQGLLGGGALSRGGGGGGGAPITQDASREVPGSPGAGRTSGGVVGVGGNGRGAEGKSGATAPPISPPVSEEERSRRRQAVAEAAQRRLSQSR